MLTSLIIFVVSLAVLIVSSNGFIDSAEKIGRALGISSFIIGVTIIAFGTSLPELATSIIAVHNDTSEIVVGNVVGSNITNILLVLSISAFYTRPLLVGRDLMNNDLTILAGSAFLLWFVLRDLTFSLAESLVFCLGVAIFLHYTIKDTKASNIQKTAAGIMPYIILPVSGFLVYLSAHYTIEGMKGISSYLGISPAIVSLSALALGTSLPEIVVSISAAKKGLHAMAIGNIMGSNVFNTFAVMAIPSFFGTLHIPAEILSFSLPFMVVVTVLFGLVCYSKRVSVWEAGILMSFYIYYLIELIQSAFR